LFVFDLMRPLFFLATGFALLLVQATFRQLVPVVALVPDPALILIIYLGVTPRQPAPAGAAVALALGYLMDLLAGAPKGLYALAYVVLFLLARLAQVRLLTRGRVFEVWYSFATAFLCGIIVTGVRALSDPVTGFRGVSVAALQALATAVTAPVVFSIGRRIDRWTSRVPDSESRSAPVKVLMK
jgi:rod shape-determining protein MreD